VIISGHVGIRVVNQIFMGNIKVKNHVWQFVVVLLMKVLDAGKLWEFLGTLLAI